MIGPGVGPGSAGSRGIAAAIPSTVAIIPLMGQSNMEGWSPLVGQAITDPRVVQLGRGASDMQLVAPSTPLHHITALAGWAGPEIGFVPAYLAARPDLTEVILVPLAEGGAGFGDDKWGVGDERYLDAVARLNHVAELRPSAHIPAFLWHQGEEDAILGTPDATYTAELDAMIAGLRSAVTKAGASTPFILGEMSHDWVGDGVVARHPKQVAIRETPSRVGNAIVVPSRGLAGGGRNAGDLVHFTSAALRTLGQRYSEAAINRAAPNLGTHTLSAQPLARYDFLDPVAPLANKGSNGAANNLVVTGDAVLDAARGLVFPVDAVTAKAVPNLTHGSGNFSLYAEVVFDQYNAAPAGHNLISSNSDSKSHAWWVYDDQIYVHTSPETAAPFAPVIGQVHRLLVTFRRSDKRLTQYIDGAGRSQAAYAGTFQTGIPWQLGRYKADNANLFAGAFRRVAIWESLLTVTDAEQIMAGNVGW